MQIDLSTTGLSYDLFAVWSPVKEASLEGQVVDSRTLISPQQCHWLLLVPNFSSTGLLQCSWFPAGEIRRGTIRRQLKRTGHQSIAKMGPFGGKFERTNPICVRATKRDLGDGCLKECL